MAILAFFQVSRPLFCLMWYSFWDDPFLSGLVIMYAVIEVVVVSEYFLQQKENNRSCLEAEIKKRQKNLLAIWSFSSSGSSLSSSSSSSSIRRSRSSKRRKRYTKYTEEKEAEDENWQKKCGNFLHFFGF